MESINFLVASIDKKFNMFIDKDETINFVHYIAEHIKRLEEISEGHHFYIDDLAFKALNMSNFPLRYTRVFSKNPENIPLSKNYAVHHIKELDTRVASKEKYSPNVQIFFIGGSDFLDNAKRFSKKLLLTVCDLDNSDLNVVDTFPLHSMEKTFTKRRDIKPEMLEQIQRYKAIINKQIPKTKTTIAPNGMIITEEIEIPTISIEDQILNTPNYMFYEYSR